MSIVPILFTVLPIAIVSSYWVSARNADNNKKDASSRKIQHNYFQGVNYLINNEPDRAVDVFVKMLEVDSDTVETHLALGALFRRKGEVNRALRIHQNLIARPQLSIEYKNQALAALGEDYLRAGVFDRAESIFLELVDSSVIQARELKFLLHIYQQEKDWNKAINIAQKLALVEKNIKPQVNTAFHNSRAFSCKQMLANLYFACMR